MWWESRHEWRLVIRAECHSNFKILQSHFQAWIRYHELFRKKRENNILAARHYEIILCQKFLSKWKGKVFEASSLHALFVSFTAERSRKTMETYFNIWREEHSKVAGISELNEKAKGYLNSKLYTKFFKLWKKRLDVKFYVDFKIEVMAAERAQRKARIFLHWLHETAVRKRPTRRLKARANKFRRLSLLLRHYYIWVTSLETLQQYQQNQQVITELATRTQTRRFFLCWKQCNLFLFCVFFYFQFSCRLRISSPS